MGHLARHHVREVIHLLRFFLRLLALREKVFLHLIVDLEFVVGIKTIVNAALIVDPDGGVH